MGKKKKEIRSSLYNNKNINFSNNFQILAKLQQQNLLKSIQLNTKEIPRVFDLGSELHEGSRWTQGPLSKFPIKISGHLTVLCESSKNLGSSQKERGARKEALTTKLSRENIFETTRHAPFPDDSSVANGRQSKRKPLYSREFLYSLSFFTSRMNNKN